MGSRPWFIVFCKSIAKRRVLSVTHTKLSVLSVPLWRTCYSIQVLNNKQVFPELYWLMAGHVVGTDGGFGLIFGRLWAISWFNLTQSYSPVTLSCQYNKMWVITVQKAAPNVAFCAYDISCIRKMALSFKIYDTPYRTEVSSLTHPSIQPPESASNAHHVLMNMINLCAGSLWTLRPPPPQNILQMFQIIKCFDVHKPHSSLLVQAKTE